MRQFVFVVPRGSPQTVSEQRLKEAESLRAKFSDCDRDVQLAREYPEVVVKDPVIRISTDLPPRLQELIEKIPDGKMTPPEPVAAGVEVVAICGRKETVADVGARREIRDQLLSQSRRIAGKTGARSSCGGSRSSSTSERSVMRPLALTLGEPAGIGPDLALALWTRREALKVPPFLLLGDPAFLAARAKLLRLEVKFAEANPEEAVSRFAALFRFVRSASRSAPPRASRTVPARTSARAAIEQGVALVAKGSASALVTNPIAKSVMQRAGFPFPGHTEFLAELAAPRGGKAPRPVMLIWSEELAVVPVTIHVPLRDVPRLLSAELIVETARIVAHDFARRFGIAHPRLAVCGLNPHAGEHGTDRTRRRRNRPAGSRATECGRHQCQRPASCRQRFSMRLRANATTWRSACITTRCSRR